MNTSEIGAFLGRFAPFDTLAPEDLEAVAAAAEERRIAAGEVVLVEDGAPSEQLWVIRSGSIELVHEGEAVDILEPGESFGHPSLLTGMAPTFTVRAHEDSVCIVIPREQALLVLGRPSGAGWVAATLRERLVQTGHVVHALPELGTVRVSELISRPPVFTEAGVTIRKAAETMTENHATAILVRDGDRLSILTDGLVRSRVVGAGLSPENPVSRVVEPAVVVPPDRIAVDAVVEMLDAGADHLVVVDAAKRVLGVLSGTDLAGLETRSPFALRHAVLGAADEDELVRVAARLRPLFLALLDAGLAPADIGRVLSLQVDSFAARLIDFAIARHGQAPVPWALLQLGSTARREFTLGSDVENALAYAASDDPEVDAYFARFGDDLARGLARCGFHLDPNDVVASNPLWRMSDARWIDVFRECLESPDRSHLIRANVAFDFRETSGGLEMTPPLVAVLRQAKEHPDLLRRLARTATDFKPPLGFRGSLRSSNGDARGIDLKQGGVIPIANLARFLALSNGITISSTLDRLTAVEEAGALDGETASALREAFEIVMRIRLAHHAAQLEAADEPDNIVDPARLTPLTRAQLREAFRAIAHAQKRLSVYVPMGV
jgi:CBS domain-containing protein